jgi:hypothetical protein
MEAAERFSRLKTAKRKATQPNIQNTETATASQLVMPIGGARSHPTPEKKSSLKPKMNYCF